MYLALVQFNPKTGALRLNAQRMLELVDELAELPYPPDLVVFPAYALTGVRVGGLLHHDAFAAECMDVTRELIAKLQLPTLFGAMIPRPLEDRYSFVCEPEVIYCRDGSGGALGFVDIHNRWNYDRYAASIDIEIDGSTLTVMLDDFPDPEDDFTRSNAIIIMLAKEYEETETMLTSSTQLSVLKEHAVTQGTWVACVNLVGGQDDSVYDGASVVIDAEGCVRDSAEAFVEQVLTVNLDLSAGRRSLRGQTRKDADGMSPNAEQEASHDAKIVRPLLPYEADWQALVVAIRDYVHKNGFDDVVLGISGGIDSAVTAALAVDALGPEHVHGILMPGPYSTPASVEDAEELASLLGMPTVLLPIHDAFSCLCSMSTRAIGSEGSGLARENLQARLRAVVLMHLSNTYGWMLLNTGNKSEAAMGYSTLYGDTAGGFAPLGTVYKTDVYGLANWRNEQSRRIPEAIVAKEPSAELREGHRDTDSLPPYDVLDRILRLHIEDGFGVDEILEVSHEQAGEQPLDPKLVLSVLSTVSKNEFKRRQEPLSPVFKGIELSTERGWPVTNGFVDRDRQIAAHADIYGFLGKIYLNDGPQGSDILEN
ncbi:MAG: NAD(+) synthase [Coriobacteriales bacterium]|jgi:NAD+ synthetase|nr:NAD(+) synthase [Coriobacteriales bacterium]